MKKNEIFYNNLNFTLFSWSAQKDLNPISVKRAEGVYLYDRDGKRYIDFSSQLMNVNIGHGHPKVMEAVHGQMKQVSYVYPGMITETRGMLGKKLAEITPGRLKKTFFTLGGADAVENAIKIARIATGRHKIITKYRSYHGATYGAISAGGDPRRHAVDRDGMPGVVHVEDPYCYRCPWGRELESCERECVSHLERIILFENPESIAAVLMEGESGSSGCIKYPPDYWPSVKAICDQYGILTIDDEVMSGFGRCGNWFAIQNFNVEPDIMVMAKGITGGYIPLGGVIVTDEIAKRFDDEVLMLGLTYSAHPVACAAGIAAIDVYEEEGLIENTRRMEQYLARRMDEFMAEHPSMGDYRNTGLLGCIELVKNRKTREPITPWNAKPHQMELTKRILSRIRELGMFTFVRWSWIFIAPPLCVTEEQIEEGLSILSEAISIADKAVD